ncbi:MAG TPA: S9 family peptidase [Thermomicrobiales bacterium]|jgi:dipeptidyl aminopeptidase/acylaminoacyl peptidase|nr:S9 family peptidase [Thermomicrobiales bacterium]
MSAAPSAPSSTPATGRPLTPDDLFRIALVSDPRPSPDGRHIAYVVTRLDKAQDTYLAAIWLAPTDPSAGAPRQLTAGTHRDTTPRWSPDGTTLAFVSNRPGTAAPDSGNDDAGKDDKGGKPVNQIWTIRLDGGEAVQLTRLKRGASGPAWSPDGGSIAFTAATSAEDEAKARGDEYQKAAVADERVVTDIGWRFDGRGPIDSWSHVWTIPATGGEPRQLTHGLVQFSDPTWSPDGSRIVFTGNQRPDRTLVNRSLLYVVPAGGGEIRSLTGEGYDYVFGQPVFSPDGSRIAVVGHDRPGTAATDRIWTVPAAGGTPTSHTDGWDRSFGDSGMSDVYVGSDIRPAWTPDGNAVLMLASDSGATHVYRVDLTEGAGPDNVTPVTTGARRIPAFAVIGNDPSRLVISSGEPHRPFELRLVGVGTDTELTRHNQAFIDEVYLSPAEEIRFQSAAGDREIQGWILTPAGVKPGSGVKHPAIIQIHGGPHGMYGLGMFHEMQLMVARGYIVLYTNPRGSEGYGEDFRTTTRGRWGESDMPDIMGGLDALLARGDVDPARVGVTGGSYGGYLTNWLVGHTDRFKVAVTQRCVSNFYSFYGTSDIGWTFGQHEFDGNPWQDAEKLLKYSPISYVDRIETPLLIIHNELDFRCPIEQAEQLFTFLKKIGKVDTEFIRIPGESHDLSRSGTPSRRLARLHHLVGWFDRYL